MFLEKYKNLISNEISYRLIGTIKRVVGLTVESEGPVSSIGELVFIKDKKGNVISKGEIVGFNNNITYIMPLSHMEGIKSGFIVEATGSILGIKVSEELLGRILNGVGELIDNKGEVNKYEYVSISNDAPNPLEREKIVQPIETGIKSIDGLLTIGKGQRIGIFAGSGVGKSTLLGMIARYSSADINVIALIGERGREVREFLERDLKDEGLKKSVVIVATSDKPAIERVKAAFVATRIAEYFRDKGKNVLLMMDSLTRFALAQREIGLAIGEPPTTRGYPPSVFALMPKLLERAGNSSKGTITGIYTVLVEGDDLDEPISDTARGILDGHIVLSRALANRNHFPAIDVLSSISRLMSEIVDNKHLEAAGKIKTLMSIYRDNEDLINLGAYQKGTNPKIDLAINLNEDINNFLKQRVDEHFSFEETLKILYSIAEKINL